MPGFDYKCDKCNEVMEFFESTALPVEMKVPEDGVCPKCKEGKLQKMFSAIRTNFDPGRFSYEYEHGKYNWKKKLGPIKSAEVLMGERDPY